MDMNNSKPPFLTMQKRGLVFYFENEQLTNIEFFAGVLQSCALLKGEV
ncbi:hypothetical protein SAMN05192559_101591 [Halobacillus karajensis]|uniref:Uncharacterized protein n=1 Tax=Halobacillus karajensis TaxID=195088 RepID=A0A024P3D0_9BACI|nr:hypothetical protein [Halobacillus karajensis]CDQ18769.1 hypothetical protein BN982_01050 [Halobacillus karajensis]CDQ23159.1 hypothetical protein BN983_01378 [Halobacillus karajensis]CDQ26641.1 hypothetical protein BN981_00858 [Halobacillus karajensis]SEH46467.1 hypothetical protein SAMN05192559_101591 [Halobacillus karajensis]